MVAKGEYDLMANRSHRRLPTLLSVRAHQHEAGGMIRDPGARISIRATGATHAPDSTGRIYDRNPFPSAVSHSCARAGSIYDRRSHHGRGKGRHRLARAYQRRAKFFSLKLGSQFPWVAHKFRKAGRQLTQCPQKAFGIQPAGKPEAHEVIRGINAAKFR